MNVLFAIAFTALFTDTADVNISIRGSDPDISFDDGLVGPNIQYAFSFDDFVQDPFPNAPGTIPIWTKVHSATVSVDLLEGGSGSMLRLMVPINEETTWNDLDGGIDGFEVGPLLHTFAGATAGTRLKIPATQMVQALANRETINANFFMVNSTTDKYRIQEGTEQLTITYDPPLLGDLDVDQDVDFDDIIGWRVAALDLDGYKATYGFPAASRGDTDLDGDFDFDDKNSFVELLTGGRIRAVPEPQGIEIAVVAAAMFLLGVAIRSWGMPPRL